MKIYTAEQIRNVGIIGHGSVEKLHLPKPCCLMQKRPLAWEG